MLTADRGQDTGNGAEQYGSHIPASVPIEQVTASSKFIHVVNCWHQSLQDPGHTHPQETTVIYQLQFSRFLKGNSCRA